MADAYHKPVLLGAVLEHLLARKPEVVLDATLGGGGHSEAILEALPGCRLIGMDADEAALEHAGRRLARFGARFAAVRGNFRRMDEAIGAAGARRVDAILMDLGVSSRQLDDPDRGFSFRLPGPLDMRMDRRQQETAADWINQTDEEEIARILRTYGEERRAKKIAQAVVRERKIHEIRTTEQLSELVARASGIAPSPHRLRTARGGKIHPATRTFQAVRIVVNDELGALEEGLGKAVGLLSVGGRLAVITFHSLEDRIAKTVIREAEKRGTLQRINKHVWVADAEEVRANPRSRSAKLRVAEKISE